MKKSISILIALLIACILQANDKKTYVKKYYPIAVREMYRSGVPASITLAQGLLESRAGLSILATKGNNHFGIKAYNWKGKTLRYDDDKRKEHFRTYANAEESFRDHSDFLRYKDRYKSLFEYEITDYKSWAKGLKKAGYATDPNYSKKLIKIIEEEGLAKYDKMTIYDLSKEEQHLYYKSLSNKDKRFFLKNKKKFEIPEPPLKLERPKRIETIEAKETYNFPLSRQLYSQNGVPFVYSIEGETYRSIAKYYDLFLKEILIYNDLKKEECLKANTIVYLQPKKKEAAIGINKFIIDKDNTGLREISQRYAVRLSSILKMNKFFKWHKTKEGDIIILRKKI